MRLQDIPVVKSHSRHPGVNPRYLPSLLLDKVDELFVRNGSHLPQVHLPLTLLHLLICHIRSLGR